MFIYIMFFIYCILCFLGVYKLDDNGKWLDIDIVDCIVYGMLVGFGEEFGRRFG